MAEKDYLLGGGIMCGAMVTGTTRASAVINFRKKAVDYGGGCQYLFPVVFTATSPINKNMIF